MQTTDSKIAMDPNDVFLTGEHVALKALTQSDVETSNWYGWFNNEETTANLQKHYYPNTRSLQEKYLETLEKDESIVQLGIVPHGQPMIVGIISIQHIDPINRNAEISIVVGESEHRRRLVSEDAIALIIEHSFSALNLHKVYLGHVETLKGWGDFLIRRFGFQSEGVWKEHAYKHGKYLDVYQLGLLKTEFYRIARNDR